MKIRVLIIITLALITACKQKQDNKYQATASTRVSPEFNPDSAYQFVKDQVDFGPRTPNSKGHEQCAAYLEAKLKSYGGAVFVQQTTAKGYDGKSLKMKNIICAFQPQLTQRVMLSAHWDTRHVADQDTVDQDKPIIGANDGGSGVAVLLEIARQLSLRKPVIGVDIILFDLEDYGQPYNSGFPEQSDTYCLGSQYWSINPPVKNYRPMYAVNFDMVGGRNAVFTMEEVSRTYAPSVLKKIWDTGNELGYSSYFSYNNTAPLTDDHAYINRIAGIPAVDIIEYDESTPSNFYKHWHTHQDNLENIDKTTLKAVGQTVLEVIFREQAATAEVK